MEIPKDATAMRIAEDGKTRRPHDADLFRPAGWEPFSPKWGSVGMLGHGECWTRNGSEWPSADEGSSACSLASILEPSVAPKYFLSPKACAGILRRAEKRGKTLPEALSRALLSVANQVQDHNTETPLQTELPTP